MYLQGNFSQLLQKTVFLFAVPLIIGGCNPKVRETATDYMVYAEAPDPNLVDPVLWGPVSDQLQGSFVSSDIRYEKSLPPDIGQARYLWKDYSWRGERISTQLVLWSSVDQDKISFEWSELTSEDGGRFTGTALKARFVRFVLTDEYAGGCDVRNNKEEFDVSLAADLIDEVDELTYRGKTAQPVWVSIDVPENQNPGSYTGSLFVNSGTDERMEFRIELEVGNAVLPAPSHWSYHLDLWQNPYAVARFHQLEPWSMEHFRQLEPLITLLASAGQKVVTTTIIHKPWNGQVEDPFETMIRWVMQEDGEWKFDYSVFDKWVDFAQKCGINDQINCYSMIPWGNKFFYYDETKKSIDSLIADPGTEAYEKHWEPFLLDFSKHLKQKGWFEKTAIAMDERPVEHMEKTMKFINRVVPGMKIHLAGGYHPEIEKGLYDISVASNQQIPEEVIQRRTAAGMVTSYYTCCAEPYPNNFTFSPPAESTWQSWHAASKGYTGYLRWAYNSWVSDPLTDSRFRSWPAGDTYIVYPEARTSIRFERLREGIQDYEKIRIIRTRLMAINTSEAKESLQLLADHLLRYDIPSLETYPAGTMLLEGQKLLDQISRQHL